MEYESVISWQIDMYLKRIIKISDTHTHSMYSLNHRVDFNKMVGGLFHLAKRFIFTRNYSLLKFYLCEL